MFRLEPLSTKTGVLMDVPCDDWRGSVCAGGALRWQPGARANAVDAIHVDAAGLWRGQDHDQREHIPRGAEHDDAPRRPAAGADEPCREDRHWTPCEQIGA